MSEPVYCEFEHIDFVDDERAGTGIIYRCVFCKKDKKVFGDGAPPTNVVCTAPPDTEAQPEFDE